MHRYIIRAEWDAEAKVWTASSEDIPGLVSEAETLEQLIQQVVDVAPELLALNSPGVEIPLPFPLHVLADRLEIVSGR